MELRVPVIAMVLAATAIPVELRSPTYDALGFSLSGWLFTDVLANFLGYVPVGLVLCDLGRLRAIATAAAIASFAEAAQLFMAHRDPSVVDVLANSAGAMLGVAIASHWKLPLPALASSKRSASIAAVLAVIVIAAAWMTAGEAPSLRGSTLPGRLEASWKLDESSGRVAEDASGHRLDGRFSKQPNRGDGSAGRVVLFDGVKDYVDFGNPNALRLAGSMTVSAWIRSTSYPVDDAAIVSSHDSAGAGYQLDTTVDTGPRTVGFKIANECGRLAARYGATPLAAGAWYHVAGVYDSEAQELDVYLNGKLDNGQLSGTVTGAQHSSRSNVYIGRRSGITGYEFAGMIRDVRIHSRALTAAEIVADMRGNAAEATVAQRDAGTGSRRAIDRGNVVRTRCAINSGHEDKSLPIAAAGLGLLVTVAGLGLWPYSSGLVWLAISLAAGMVLPASSLPAINLWLFPLTSLAGAAAALVSIRRGR